MEISPQRVRSAEFKTVRKGADPDEIKAFLNEVADELERAQNQSTAMEARARAAIARLQEMNEGPRSDAASPAPAVSVPDASPDEAETISRTLLLAQRTADSTVAEARAEAAAIVQEANTEATTTLDSARRRRRNSIDEARASARQAGEAERITVAGEVEALKARRDFLESDVEQLELFLTDQRSRLREAATALIDVTERVPGGLGEVRPPLLPAGEHGPTSSSSTTVRRSPTACRTTATS
jgi:cell division septum initiation protein DivIVA